WQKKYKEYKRHPPVLVLEPTVAPTIGEDGEEKEPPKFPTIEHFWLTCGEIYGLESDFSSFYSSVAKLISDLQSGAGTIQDTINAWLAFGLEAISYVSLVSHLYWTRKPVVAPNNISVYDKLDQGHSKECIAPYSEKVAKGLDIVKQVLEEYPDLEEGEHMQKIKEIVLELLETNKVSNELNSKLEAVFGQMF
ncbi:MAG: hypothetical protein IJS50_02470, partial [Desulfovibrio sp.]|nr:hypothetical protein [Desulfovibrio sp.]